VEWVAGMAWNEWPDGVEYSVLNFGPRILQGIFVIRPHYMYLSDPWK